jgi:hypothetical protein
MLLPQLLEPTWQQGARLAAAATYLAARSPLGSCCNVPGSKEPTWQLLQLTWQQGAHMAAVATYLAWQQGAHLAAVATYLAVKSLPGRCCQDC